MSGSLPGQTPGDSSGARVEPTPPVSDEPRANSPVAPPPIPPPTQGSIFEQVPTPDRAAGGVSEQTVLDEAASPSPSPSPSLVPTASGLAPPPATDSSPQSTRTADHPGAQDHQNVVDRSGGSDPRGSTVTHHQGANGSATTGSAVTGSEFGGSADIGAVGSERVSDAGAVADRVPPTAGLVLQRGDWFGIGSDAEVLRQVLDRLDGGPSDTSTADEISLMVAEQPSIVALAHNRVAAESITIGLRSGGSARVMRDAVATHHVIGDATTTTLIIDRPFDSVALSGFHPAPGALTGQPVPAGRYPAAGSGLIFFAGEVAASGDRGPDVASIIAASGTEPYAAPTPAGSVGSGPRIGLADRHWLVGDEVIIGRGPFQAPSDDVAVDDPFMDAIHAGFLVTDAGIHLADLRSRSGTYVRADTRQRWVRIDPDEPLLLRDACDIRVGRTTFRFLP